TAEPPKTASGSIPSSRARSSDAITTAAAPSLTPDELPAVTVPPSRNTTRSPASFSSVAAGRRRPARPAAPTATTPSSTRRAAAHRVAGAGDRGQARRAESVDGHAADALRQPRQQDRHAGDVAVVLARLVGAAEPDVLELVLGNAGALDGRADRNRGQVVGTN